MSILGAVLLSVIFSAVFQSNENAQKIEKIENKKEVKKESFKKKKYNPYK